MSGPDANQPLESSLAPKVHHASKLLARALKTAKSSHQQKFTRQKNEAGLKELKDLDLKELAKHQIHKRLKIPSKFPAGNMSAQLINTKPVKNAMPEIDRFLQINDGPLKTKDGKATQSPSAKEDHQRAGRDGPGRAQEDSHINPARAALIDVHNGQSESPADPGKKDPSRDSQKSKTQPSQKRTKNSHGESTFLSSLGSGLYASDSDQTDDTNEPPKKKRKGQIARRREWERKYGAEANHLKGQHRPKPRKPQQQRAGKDGNDVKPDKKHEVPLHPSWEAAKKARDQKAATFQGKKVVFD